VNDPPDREPRSSPGAVPRFTRSALRETVRASDSYGLLLFLLLINYVVLAANEQAEWFVLVRTVVVAATVLLAFHTSHVRGRWLTFIRVAVAVVALVAIIGAFLPGLRWSDAVSLLLGIFIAASPVVVLNRILRHEQVGIETILGAICVYVLLGLAFAFFDDGMAAILGPHHPFFAQNSHPESSDFLYFSFITLTTTGYGDLTPLGNAPRTASVFEAVIGQVFLVTLVARLVALYKPRSRAEDLAAQAARRDDAGDHRAENVTHENEEPS